MVMKGKIFICDRCQKETVIPEEYDIPDGKKIDTLIDIRTYKEKVIDYLYANGDNETIKRIKNTDERIVGETFIKPKMQYTYEAKILGNGRWSIDEKYPVKIKVDKDNPKKIYLI